MPVVPFLGCDALWLGLLAWAEEAQQGLWSAKRRWVISAHFCLPRESCVPKARAGSDCPSEFKPVIRYLPQLIEKIQIERLASDSPYVLFTAPPQLFIACYLANHPSMNMRSKCCKL